MLFKAWLSARISVLPHRAAARLVFQLESHEPVPLAVIQLHWLPVTSRITYKLCLLMYRIRAGNCPSYLSSIVEPAFARSTRSGLRSADSSKYTLPHLRTKLGERALSYAGPAAWNTLPDDVRAAISLETFKCRLKTLSFLQLLQYSNCVIRL
jgi:hypothetical protein